MKPTVFVALFGWPLLALVLFVLLQPRRAVIATILLGWMFLPMASYKVASGIPEFTKMMSTVLAALLGVLIFDFRRILSFRPDWIDLPMAVWCLCPFASSITNDLGIYDGFSSVFYKTISWGVPYLLGRLYCSTLLGMADLATGIFLGGLVYLPLCLIEIRLSPQLHNWVYGYHPHSFDQTVRYGGYRPTVFMEHGLMVSMWMAMATLTGIWLWASKTLRRLGRIPLPWLFGALLVTTLLCKSLGAAALLGVGLAVLGMSRVLPSYWYLLLLALLAPLYLTLRVPKMWSGTDLTEASAVVSEGRASSLKFRLVNEDRLIDKALQRPMFGWGSWGRARVRDHDGRDISVTDGLWIIEIGNEGLVGLVGMVLVFMMPLLGLCRAVPLAAWDQPAVAPAVALCVVVLLHLTDCLFNNMNNPAYMLAAGGLAFLRASMAPRPDRAPERSEGVPWAAPS